MATPISYTLDLDYSVIDKRISAIRIYLSENALSATEAITSYYFQKELSIGRDYFQQCSVSNLFGIYLPTGFIRQTDTLSYVITDGELPDILGYTPTTDYAYSWDKAIISNGKVFALNPQLLSNYYKNKILVSPVSGAGAFQYDVLVPDQATYLDFETFDGNNVQGMLLMPNLDYFLLRESSVQGIDSQTGVTRFTDILGLTGKNAYGSGGNKFMFLSDVDIYIGNSSEIKNVSDGTIRDKYRALSLTDRQTSFLTYELRDNSPRIAFNAGATEMILSPRGWMTAKRNAMPVNYVQSSDNKIWFIGGTNIYKDSDQTLDDTTPITATWKSAPIDISLLGSDIKANTRFVLGKVWLKYKSSVSVTINIYLDGSSTPFQIITAPSNLTDDDFYSAKIQIGVNSLYFQVELVAVTTATNSSCRIMACGFLWKPASVGFRG